MQLLVCFVPGCFIIDVWQPNFCSSCLITMMSLCCKTCSFCTIIHLYSRIEKIPHPSSKINHSYNFISQKNKYKHKKQLLTSHGRVVWVVDKTFFIVLFCLKWCKYQCKGQIWHGHFEWNVAHLKKKSWDCFIPFEI